MNQIQTTTNIPELTLEHFKRYSTHEIMGICELNKVGDIEVDIGHNEGLRYLKEGDEAFLFLPYQLAYGEKGVRGIPPKSNLIFEVKIVEVTD